MNVSHTMEIDVKRPRVPVPAIALHDYRPALQTAVNWLGERYLLAEPVAKRNAERSVFFRETRRWHPATRH